MTRSLDKCAKHLRGHRLVDVYIATVVTAILVKVFT